MQFNTTDKSLSLIAHVDFLLFGDSSTFNTSYSLADRTRNMNISLDEIIVELFNADPNFMWDDKTNVDFPIATLDLVANRDHYTIPDESLVIHRMRIKDQSGSFITLTPKNRRELSDSDLASTGTPTCYYKIDNGLFPIPVPDYGYTSGVELEFQRGANHFVTTDTDKMPGFNPQFHAYLSIDTARQYAVATGMKEKMSFLQAEKDRMKLKIQEHYARRSPDDRTRLRIKRQYTNNTGL